MQKHSSKEDNKLGLKMHAHGTNVILQTPNWLILKQKPPNFFIWENFGMTLFTDLVFPWQPHFDRQVFKI